MTVFDAHKRYTVVGLGLTGLSCVSFLKNRQVEQIRVFDSREMPPGLENFQSRWPEVSVTCGDLNQYEFNVDEVVIVSPGIALTDPLVLKAIRQGAVVSSDIELFLQVNDKPVIAITGSNGKSTVTTLVGDILVSAGKHACVAGNIGFPILQRIDEQDAEGLFDIFVLELSSFQLERLSALNADAVTILNVSEDHMDRYVSFEDYVAAKQRIFVGAKSILVNADDDLTAVPGNDSNAEITNFSLAADCLEGMAILDVAGVDWIAYSGEALLKIDDIKVKGRHNIANVMAAMALCRAVGLEWSSMTAAVKAFKGLPHRCEWVANKTGVDFYNDSKATNVGAAVAAIEGFSGSSGSLVLIAGGQDKDSDFMPLAASVIAHVHKVILFGQDAHKIAAVLPQALVIHVSSIIEAVSMAAKQAQPKGVVLFSPACASFDMFKNFEDRGDSFISAVNAL